MKFISQGPTETFLKENVGIILSYGKSEDIIPAGVFKINNLINIVDGINEKEYKAFEGTIVELKNNDENNQEKICIPLPNFLEIFPSKMAILNKYEFNEVLDEKVSLDTLDAFKRTLWTINKNMHSYNKEVYKARYKSLSDLNAVYFNSNGDIMGDNYSIVPFALDGKLIDTLKKEKNDAKNQKSNAQDKNYVDEEQTHIQKKKKN